METFNGYDNWKCTPPDDDEAYENMLEKVQEWTPEEVHQYCYMTKNHKLWEKLLEDIAEAEIERLGE